MLNSPYETGAIFTNDIALTRTGLFYKNDSACSLANVKQPHSCKNYFYKNMFCKNNTILARAVQHF